MSAVPVHHVEGHASCCEVIAALDLRPDLPTISASTLAIAGAHDPAIIAHQTGASA